ncbi:reverse transcriptase domain-containing protein [Tanacetum coccineum]|uniref:Reverse transcriptase domain-containing protein n=1 Tax=Tanacetum coccineum TaxID=301880 RepID=A0ABQ5AAE0_9ASTR
MFAFVFRAVKVGRGDEVEVEGEGDTMDWRRTNALHGELRSVRNNETKATAFEWEAVKERLVQIDGAIERSFTFVYDVLSDSIARTSSSSGVKHLIPSRLTRYLNISSDKALVNKSAVISDIDVLGTGMLDWIARDGYELVRSTQIKTHTQLLLKTLRCSPASSFKEVEREAETITDPVLTESTRSVPPLFAKMVKDLLTNKEKLLELANTPLNENCSAVLLKKLPEKLGDTGGFSFHTLSLPELTPTRMTLELATRTVAYLAGIAEDVFVQVGKFTFPADFVVVDYDVDTRVPLILGRPFLRTVHALVDVHEEELTLQVGDEKLVFNVESTSKYPRKHDDKSINKIDILDITCEDHFHEVLNVQNDFILEEIDTFLASHDSTSPDVDDGTFDMEGDIHLIDKSSIDDPTHLELKDLPSHLDYAFLEGTSKLPVIISKDLKREGKEQLLKVLKSHKRAIAWKISDIWGIDPNFCTHKILIEDDFKQVV